MLPGGSRTIRMTYGIATRPGLELHYTCRLMTAGNDLDDLYVLSVDYLCDVWLLALHATLHTMPASHSNDNSASKLKNKSVRGPMSTAVPGSE